jgi:hypothetical protein
MNLDKFNTTFGDGEIFEDEPTSVLQQIAGKAFSVVKVKSGISKAGKEYCIVWTDKAYQAGVNIAEANEEADYKIMACKKFFVTTREQKQMFSDTENQETINNGIPLENIKITKKQFTAEEIGLNPKLKGKSHYITEQA